MKPRTLLLVMAIVMVTGMGSLWWRSRNLSTMYELTKADLVRQRQEIAALGDVMKGMVELESHRGHLRQAEQDLGHDGAQQQWETHKDDVQRVHKDLSVAAERLAVLRDARGRKPFFSEGEVPQ